MSELTKTLLNIRSLRAAARELTLEQLEDALSKLTTVFTERKEEEEAQRAAAAEQEAKLAAIAEQISKEGIDIDALYSALAGETKPKQNRNVHLVHQNINTWMQAVKLKLGQVRVAPHLLFNSNWMQARA